MYNHTILSI